MKTLKAIKVTYLGKQLREVYPHASKWQVIKYKTMRAVRWVVVRMAMGAAFGAVVFGAYAYGQFEAGRTQTVVNQIAPMQKESMAAVMQRIAGCESEGKRSAVGKQFNADGSIVTHTNDNGSVDVGKYQINMTTAHITQMAKLGLNPLTEKGNEAFAKWIYENEGTGAWSASQHCWQ